MHPDHWYPAEYDARVLPGQAIDVTFWGKSIAVWRDINGDLHAVENRCAHRQIKLSKGEVRGCTVVCPYHGWTYDGSGRLVDVPHELFGKERPNIKLHEFPLAVRYGLIWFFPGDPAKAATTPLPSIPELEGPAAWACVPIDYTWRAHHSMILDNVCDFTHEYLHKKWQPFHDARLTGIDVQDHRILVDYDTRVGAGFFYDAMIDRRRSGAQHMQLGYEYPHQWSNTDGRFKHWMMVLPVDERTTRCFFLFYYEGLNFPFLPLRIPRRLMKPLLTLGNRLLMRPLLDEDGWAVEAEQEGYETNFDAPIAELSPVVKAFQAFTIRKWEEYLAQRDSVPPARRLPVVPRSA
jgi:hypothetical protein